MNRTTYAISFAILWPCVAHAALINVEYSGTIVNVDDPPPGYAVGDVVSGTLTIDTDLAGPDTRPLDPNDGLYGAPPGPFTDFVTGYTTSSQGSSDYVSVELDVPLNGDIYAVTDQQFSGTSDFNSLFLQVTLDGLLQNDNLVQSFEVTTADDPFFFSGFIERNMGEAYQYVEFALSRLSVKPGRCAR